MRQKICEKQVGQNSGNLKANNKEKIWEQVLDTFGGKTVFFTFQNFETRYFQILEKSLFPNPGKVEGIFRFREWTKARIGSLVR